VVPQRSSLLPESEPLRFTDILTTAAAVANYLGRGEVIAPDLLAAVCILLGEKTMEQLGRPLSPLVRRQSQGPGATAEVRALVQRWWAELGESPGAVLDEAAVARLRADLQALTVSES